MMNTIIVDDEPLAIEILESFSAKIPELNVIAHCENAMEANEILKSEKVDLMFLDIQMPQITGIEFLKSLSNPPQVIITSAFPEYAVDGFELNVADYLLKPVSFERFLKAVNKVSDNLRLKNQVKQGETSSDQAGFFFVKADKKLVKVNFDDLIYVEGLKDYVILRCESGRIITLQTMKSLEERLSSLQFKRIHRSYIVNLDKILAVDGNSVEVNEKGTVKLLPIGKNYRDELLEMVNDKKL
jgi:DNA-binding LytR/AlgR family response regulator